MLVAIYTALWEERVCSYTALRLLHQAVERVSRISYIRVQFELLTFFCFLFRI